MALGDPYATLEELKAYLMGQQVDNVDDAQLADALDSVSREIQDTCDRQFNDAEQVSSRLFGRDAILRDPDRGLHVAWVHDFSTDTGLVVETDNGDDGTYSTTWTQGADFELEPLNGIVDGSSGWPYYRIVPVGAKEFPRTRRAPLRVTAQWGWEEVPAPVHQATLILASETAKLRNAPFGVAGFGDFGPVRVRDNPMAFKKLKPYILNAVAVA